MHKRTRITGSWLRRDRWTLWEWWVLATVVGGLTGMGIAGITSAIAGNLGTVSTVTLSHAVGALEGMALGFSQWLVLRRYIKHFGWWILATGLGAIVGWLIGLKFIVVLALIFFDRQLFTPLSFALLEAVFFLGAWIGAVLGIAQWLVLRTYVRNGIMWVFANALAWGVGLLVILIGATLTKPGDLNIETALIGVATGATTGVVVGSITGIALVWLLKPHLLKY